MAKKTPKKPVKKAAKPAKKEKTFDFAVKKAAKKVAEVAEEDDEVDEPQGFRGFDPVKGPDDHDMELADMDFAESSPEEIQEKDVFVDAERLAKEKMTRPKFRIYRDSKFTAVIEGGYSWEKLQRKYGGGHYRVVAVDLNNQWLSSQAMEVDNPPNWDEPHTGVQPQSPLQEHDPLELADRLRERDSRAEDRARHSAENSTNGFASMVSAIVQAGAQSQNTIMTMIQESNRQQQQMTMEMNKLQNENSKQMTQFMMTILTQKKGSDDGMGPLELLKLQMEAEKRAEDRQQRFQDRLDKKVNDIKEEMQESASSDGEEKEESIVKTLVKGFIPLLTQASQQPQVEVPPTPEQLAQIEQQRYEEHVLRMKAAGYVIPEQPKIAAPAPVAANRTQAPGVPDRKAMLKQRVFDFLKEKNVAGMIQDGVLAGDSASKVAEGILKVLENSGLPRHTVASTLTVEDYRSLARINGVPDAMIEAMGSWIEEFNAHVQQFRRTPASTTVKTAAPVGVPVPVDGTQPVGTQPGVSVGKTEPSDTLNGAGATVVSAAPVKPSGTRERAGEPPQNLGN